MGLGRQLARRAQVYPGSGWYASASAPPAPELLLAKPERYAQQLDAFVGFGDGHAQLGSMVRAARVLSLAGTRLFRAGQAAASKLPEVLAYYAALGALLSTPLPLHTDGDGHELQPRPLRLDPGATAIWIEFYDEVERQQADGAPLAGVRAWASKAAEHAARISAVITLMEDPRATEVPTATMEGAVAVAAFYLGEHVRLMGQSAEMLHLRRLHNLLSWLRSRGPKVKHVDVLQYLTRDLRDLKAEGIKPLLAELESRAYIRRSGDTWEVRRA